MANPIEFRFLRKLEIYQDLREYGCGNHSEWKIEKNILSWAANRELHKDLETPLTPEMALEHNEITGIISSEIQDKRQYICNRFGNLVAKKYAKYADNQQKSNSGILFERDGFLAGEIINKKKRSTVQFFIAYYGTWALFISGAIVSVGNAFPFIKKLICYIYGIISGLSK
jgi:hypothetical protein